MMRRLLLCVLVISLLAAVRPAAAQTLIGTVATGNGSSYLAANPATNQIYVANFGTGTDPGSTMTVINGATDQTTTVTVGNRPEFFVINPVTNKIYVNNRRGGTVSVLDGRTNTVIKTITGFDFPIGSDVNPITNRIYVANSGNGTDQTVGVIDGTTDTLINTITVDLVPLGLAVNPVTNKIYVMNQCGTSNNCTSNGTVTVIDGATNQTTSIPVDWNPQVILVNQLTNKIYVLNNCGNNAGSADCLANGTATQSTVTVIDGATNGTQRVNVGTAAGGLTVNQVTNETYVANSGDNTVTFINGSTLATSLVNVGTSPADVEVNPNTYKIYVTNYGANSITMIDGTTHHTTSLAVGSGPGAAAVNPVTNRYYNINSNDNTVSVVAGGNANAVQFVPVTPCRLVDTRPSKGGGGPIAGGTSESFPLPQLGGCGIPATASAYSLNVTVVPATPLGYLTIWPTGAAQPVVSTMNSLDGRFKANAAIVPAGYQGAVSVYASNTTNVILDINGYFTAPGAETLQFYSLPPCRVLDTRNTNGPLGGPFLEGGVKRDFPLTSSSCIPSGPAIKAYSLNFTAVPYPDGQQLGYLTAWPEGQTQPVVSTLNNPTATFVANAAIVPAGTGGGISVFVDETTHLAVDINGYFAAPGSGGLSLYPTSPCRVLDTRQAGGQFTNELTVNVAGSPCTLPSTAQGYVFNATVVPSPQLSYLTLWPDGLTKPVVSTLNAADGDISSNMAIVPTTNGKIDAFAAGTTQLILDLSGFFAP
jgi:YVTN family beta-propeller protein